MRYPKRHRAILHVTVAFVISLLLASHAIHTDAFHHIVSWKERQMSEVAETALDLVPTGHIGGYLSAAALSETTAYIGYGRQVHALDISNPNHPIAMTRSPLLEDSVNDIVVSGSYVIGATYKRLRAFDTSNPSDLRVVSETSFGAKKLVVKDSFIFAALNSQVIVVELATPIAMREIRRIEIGSKIEDIELVNNHLVVLTTVDVRVLDLSNPAAPTQVGQLPNSCGRWYEGIVNNKTLFIPTSRKLCIIEITDNGEPRQITTLPFSGYVAASIGHYLYLRDDRFNKPILRVVDIQDLDNPRIVNEVRTPQDWGISCLRAYNKRLLACSDVGPILLDIADPVFPRFTGSFSTFPASKPLSKIGHFAFVSSFDAGVRVLDISNPQRLQETFYIPDPGFSMAVQGQYAYMGSYSLVKVLDVSSPQLPHTVAQVGIPTINYVYPTYVKIHSNWLFAAADEQLVVLDVSNPLAPRRIVDYQLPDGCAIRDFDLSQQYLYAVCRSSFVVVDFTTVEQPILVNTFSDPVWEGFSKIIIAEDRAYLLRSWAGIDILDLQNPAAPTKIEQISLSNLSDFDLNGSLLATTQTEYTMAWDTNIRVAISNIAGLSSSKMLARVTLPGNGTTQLFMLDQSVYVANAASGFFTIDVLEVPATSIGVAGGDFTIPADDANYHFMEESFSGAVSGIVQVRHRRASVCQNDELLCTFGPLPYDKVSPSGIFVVSGQDPLYGYPVQPNKPFQVQWSLRPDIVDPRLFTWNGNHWTELADSRIDQGILIGTMERFAVWTVFSTPHQTFLPLVYHLSNQDDLALIQLHVTQSVQTEDNDIPLVADRPTVVRAIVRTASTKPIHDVHLSLSGTRNGQPLPDSPLTIGPQTIFPDEDIWASDHSYNLLLPPLWRNGTVELTAEVNSTHTFRESDESNNRAVRSITFQPVPTLQLTLVPITYTHTPTGKTYPAPNQDLSSHLLRSAFPVANMEVTWRQPLTFSGDFRSLDEWRRFLSHISDIKLLDGAPESRFYLGIVPVENLNSPEDSWWYLGRFHGVAWLGRRVAVASYSTLTDDASSLVAAHELGHNMGLMHHAPCTSPVDPNFPYPDGTIGQYGFDPFSYRAFMPHQSYDFMCVMSRYWLSDYNYRKALENLQSTGSNMMSNQPSTSLVVRITLDKDDQPILHPVYQLGTPPETSIQENEYQLELLDIHGNVIGEHRTSISRAHMDTANLAEGAPGIVSSTEINLRTIFIRVPTPKAIVAVIRLRHDRRIIREWVLRPSSANIEIDADFANSSIRLAWDDRALPILVRFTRDAGVSWTTLTFDTIGGSVQFDSLPISHEIEFEVSLAGGGKPYRVKLDQENPKIPVKH